MIKLYPGVVLHRDFLFYQKIKYLAFAARDNYFLLALFLLLNNPPQIYLEVFDEF